MKKTALSVIITEAVVKALSSDELEDFSPDTDEYHEGSSDESDESSDFEMKIVSVIF